MPAGQRRLDLHDVHREVARIPDQVLTYPSQTTSGWIYRTPDRGQLEQRTRDCRPLDPPSRKMSRLCGKHSILHRSRGFFDDPGKWRSIFHRPLVDHLRACGDPPVTPARTTSELSVAP